MLCWLAVASTKRNWNSSQLRELIAMEQNVDIEELRQTIRRLRDEELEHLHEATSERGASADANGSGLHPAHGMINAIVQGGCRIAIMLVAKVK